MLWLALHLPALSLEAFCATLPPAQAAQPVAVLAGQGLGAVNAAAAERGLRPGQRRATALALVPELLLGQASTARDAAALLAVAHVALAFTPMVVLDGAVNPPGGARSVTDSAWHAVARTAAHGMATGTTADSTPDTTPAIAATSVSAQAQALSPAEGLATLDPAVLSATVLMEVQASLRLFGGLASLLQRLDQALAPLGHRLQCAAAPTPAAAALLARWQPSARVLAAAVGPRGALASPPRRAPGRAAAQSGAAPPVSAQPAAAPPATTPPATTPPATAAAPLLHGPHTTQVQALAALLAAAPLALLNSVHAQAHTLLGMGLHTLADVAALPRSGLARRFGVALLEELDRLHGRRPDLRLPLQLPPVFDSALELHARADTSDQVLAGAQVLLGRLLAWAQGRQVRLCAFVLRMQHERHRGAAVPATVLRVELAEASLDPAHLHLLLRERLGRCALAAPTLMLALHCREVTAGAAPNAELFPARQSADEGLTQLLERWRARLGDNAVYRVLPLADHRPERAQCQVPARAAVQPTPPGSGGATWPSHLPLSRPAWLLAEPLPLRVAVHERLPRYQGRVLRLLSGPERIETGWWDGQAVARDYYIAADADGSLLWIWRERQRPLQPGVSPPWFLHGLFG